jgi:hypothetical protein
MSIAGASAVAARLAEMQARTAARTLLVLTIQHLSQFWFFDTVLRKEIECDESPDLLPP